MIRTLSTWLAFLLLSAAVAGEEPEVVARRAEPAPKIDGRVADDPAWKHAVWVELDKASPEAPTSEAGWNALGATEGMRRNAREQFGQRVRAAVLWSEAGLYFAWQLEDIDVIGRMKDGETLWLEDAVELFLAPARRQDAPYLEFQINPVNSALIFFPARVPCSLEHRQAVHVDGTLNRGLSKDRGWSVELFLPWSELEARKIAVLPPGRKGGIAGAVRFAAWDLSIHTHLRLLRYTGPGGEESCFPLNYRILRLTAE